MKGNDDEQEEVENEENELQIRIQLKLSPHITENRSKYELSSSNEMAVPSTIRRKGLSILVNHLLQIESEEETEQESNFPFDFIINKKLLRTKLDVAVRRYYQNFEETVILEYFPSYPAPQLQEEPEEKQPDWISSLKYISSKNQLLCSCYDGSIQVFENSSKITSLTLHSAPIKCLDGIPMEDGILIGTGGMDHALKTCILNENNLVNVVDYKNGHFNSVTSVALQAKNDEIIMSSGDWDGGLCMWKISQEKEENRTKKSKTDSTIETTTKTESSLLSNLKAHSSCVSDIKFSNATPNMLITSSHDYSLKLFDVAKQDFITTYMGNRVITSMDVAINTDVVITTHPDCTVQLWDVRTNSETMTTNKTMFQPSHELYVSQVKWHPTDPCVFVTTSYDGSCKLWDIRSTSLPLYTFNKDEKKGLCVEFGGLIQNTKREIYCAGTDCIVKKYLF